MPVDFQADALYFQALESGAGFAVHQERVVNPKFQYHFGARARVGVLVGCDDWRISVAFLHYHARTRRSAWEQMWRLHLGLLDGTLSKDWIISNTLSLRLIGGIRYGEIRHKLEEVSSVCMKNKFFGIGPLVGCEGVLGLSSCFELYLRSAFTLFFGRFYVHQDRPPMKFYNEFRQNETALESCLGLRFSRCWFYGQLAYEFYLFPGQNQLARFPSTEGKFIANQGDLSLQGPSLGVGIRF